MFNYPFGQSQQINLSWILNEIITLHQALDPDYVPPVYNQGYPFSNLSELNLDWILRELKTLKELAPDPENLLLQEFKGGNITPVYIGDYIADNGLYPGCAIKIGNFFYTLDAHSRQYNIDNASNEGVIRKFSIVNNIEVTAEKQTANIGHANSIAYDSDNEIVYVAPIWNCNSGTETVANYLYTFDSNMQAIGTEIIPSAAMGVSFDPITKTLYFITHSGKIYRKSNSSWNLYSEIDLNSIKDSEIFSARAYNQDFAVYNNIWYITSPYGNIISGIMAPEPQILNHFTLNYNDSLNRFQLGEYEGLEFAADGHLYCINYQTYSNDCRNGFICELTIGDAPSFSPSGNDILTYTSFILTLSSTTQTKFALNANEIRSLNQLYPTTAFNNQSAQVTIPAGDTVIEPYTIYISRDLLLNISGIYDITSFIIYKGTLGIYSENNSNQLIIRKTTGNNGAGYGISLFRTGKLQFAGDQRIHISVPYFTAGDANKAKYFIGIGVYYSQTFVRLAPDNTQGLSLGIGGKILADGTQYQGSGTVLNEYNWSDFIDLSTITDDITNLGNDVGDLQTDVQTLQNEVQPINRGGTGSTSARDAVSALLGNPNLYSFYITIPANSHKLIRLRGDSVQDYVIRGLLCIGGVDNIKGVYSINKSSIGTNSNYTAIVPYSGPGTSSLTISVVSQANGGITIEANTAGLTYSLVLSFLCLHLNKALDNTFPVVEDIP